MVASNEVLWLTSADGSQRVGVCVVGDSDTHDVELYTADAHLVATLDTQAAAELVRQLQTAADFADIVGHDRFSLSAVDRDD